MICSICQFLFDLGLSIIKLTISINVSTADKRVIIVLFIDSVEVSTLPNRISTGASRSYSNTPALRCTIYDAVINTQQASAQGPMTNSINH